MATLEAAAAAVAAVWPVRYSTYTHPGGGAAVPSVTLSDKR